MRAIFICSGNICRSPMAEAIFRRMMAEREWPGMAVSMGTLNLFGRPAAPHAVTAMAEVGLDLSGHRSQGLSMGLLRHADRVLCMEAAHIEHLRRLDPVVAARAELLGAYDPDGPLHIEDPVNRELPAFRLCRDRLARAVARLIRESRGVV